VVFEAVTVQQRLEITVRESLLLLAITALLMLKQLQCYFL